MVVQKLRLLLGREFDHCPSGIGITHGGEDLSANAEIRMTMVLVLLSAGKKHD